MMMMMPTIMTGYHDVDNDDDVFSVKSSVSNQYGFKATLTVFFF
jgi:hypothetical protein